MSKPHVNVTNRIYSFIDRIKHIDYNLMPVTLEIHLTDFCNNSCLFCYYNENIVKEDKKFLPTDIVIQTIQDFAMGGGQSIVLSGGGEPLLHPDFIKIMNLLTELKIDTGIITNGIKGDDQILKAMSNAAWVKFSLHTFNNENYNKIIGQDNNIFPVICSNIRRFVQLKKDTVVSTGCVVSALNEDENSLLNFFDFSVEELGVDYVLYRPYFGYNNDLKITLSKDKLAKTALKIHKKSEQYNVFSNFSSLVRDINSERVYIEGKCPIIQSGLMAAISSQGDIFLCLPFARDNMMQTSIGSIYSDSFKNIWLGNKRRQILNSIDNSICPACKYEKMFPLLENIDSIDNNKIILAKQDKHWRFL